MTRDSRTVSFTNQHCDLLEKMSKERKVTFSEALRLCLDFVQDHDPSLGLPFYEGREKSLRAELLTVQEAKKKLEEERKSEFEDSAGTPPLSLGVNGVRAPAPKTVAKPHTDKRPTRTDDEQFLKAAPYVANEDKAVTPELKKKVLAQAREHPEWVAKVQEPERNKLEAMLRIPKIGGREE